MTNAFISFVRLGARVFQSCYDIMLKKPTQFISPWQISNPALGKDWAIFNSLFYRRQYKVNGAEFSPTTSIGITVCLIAPTINNFIAFYN